MTKAFKVLSAILCIAAISCQKTQSPDSTVEEEHYIQVSLGFSGEITDITTTPMSKAEKFKDWYQIQVYSCPLGQDNYSYYGYGFFDNKDNMVINLKEGYQYRFVADMIVEGEKNILSFSLFNSGWATISNNFYLSFDEHIRYLGEGYIYMSTPHEQFNRPNVDRFFGITEGYVPEERGKVSIKMKRVSFGAKFIAKDFEEGFIEVAIDQAPSTIIEATNGSETDKITISFKNTMEAYLNDKYSENIAVNVIWIKNDGVRVPVVSQEIEFVRNHLTSVKFDLKETSKSSSFSITSDENWQNGEIIEVENGGINTEIRPK
ncbi:MAG: hypothetical protein J6A22_08855 [Bacteroidales bacterium]|nr:hypothetical protein [Bacteroidales bacterium]